MNLNCFFCVSDTLYAVCVRVHLLAVRLRWFCEYGSFCAQTYSRVGCVCRSISKTLQNAVKGLTFYSCCHR